MNKQEFLKQLKRQLKKLPPKEREEQLTFYSELIADKMEEGATEEEAILSIGNAKEIASRILTDTEALPLDETEKRHLRGWELLLLILGSPLWFSLLLAFCGVAISVFAVIFSLVLVAWVITLPFLLLGEIGKYMFWASKTISKLSLKYTQKCISKIKYFLRKR